MRHADAPAARAVPVHRELRAQHHGREHPQPAGQAADSSRTAPAVFRPGEVHPLALELLRQNGIPTAGLRSKTWDEFAVPGAPDLDFVFTVCDKAAGETCPIWPGQPMTAHWGIADPAAVKGTDDEKRHAFFECLPRTQPAHQDLHEPADSLAGRDQACKSAWTQSARPSRLTKWPEPALRTGIIGRGSWRAAACHGGHRFRNHGGAAGGRKPGHCAARQHRGDRRRAGDVDRHARAGERRAFQSRRVHGRDRSAGIWRQRTRSVTWRSRSRVAAPGRCSQMPCSSFPSSMLRPMRALELPSGCRKPSRRQAWCWSS